MSRRALLVSTATAGTVGVGLWTLFGPSEDDAIDLPQNPVERVPPQRVGPLAGPPFDPRARACLVALYAYLLPGDPERGVPSAKDAGVFDYVERAARLPGLRPLRDNVLKLARFLDKKTAPETFAAVDVARATQVLLETAVDERPLGRFVPARALETSLRLGLEGYLGHPEHGGNRDFVAWRALDIRMPKERYPLEGGHHGGHAR